jgi:ketosteroid isomerase-like protein
VRSIYAQWKHGDFGLVDRESQWRDSFELDFESHTRDDLPRAGVPQGYEGSVRLRDLRVETFDNMHVDLDELIDAGDHVIGVRRLCGGLRGACHELDGQETQVWKIRDGRATEVRAYLTRSEALKAVRLEK